MSASQREIRHEYQPFQTDIIPRRAGKDRKIDFVIVWRYLYQALNMRDGTKLTTEVNTRVKRVRVTLLSSGI
jgi:hypothetical protein